VVRGSWLFRDDSPEKTKQAPTQQGSGDSREDTTEFHQKDSGKKEQHGQNKEQQKKSCRRGMVNNRRLQAGNDTAGKRCGDRYGRQPHGTLLNLTSVSM
jgi:hypothetical protein